VDICGLRGKPAFKRKPFELFITDDRTKGNDEFIILDPPVAFIFLLDIIRIVKIPSVEFKSSIDTPGRNTQFFGQKIKGLPTGPVPGQMIMRCGDGKTSIKNQRK
jgi:hypothetical protein